MIIIDISMPIVMDMPVYKDRDEKRPKMEVTRDFTTGSVYESKLTLEMHTGTHMDAPLHMIEGGEDITLYNIADYVSPAKVLDLSHVKEHITEKDLLEKEIKAGEFVLLKTKNSWDEGFNAEFIYLEKSGAKYLADLGIVGVGIDSLGIERAQPDHETHKTLLGQEIMILEGLRLKHVNEGEFTLIATPLNIPGAEASPVRALLMNRDALNI